MWPPRAVIVCVLGAIALTALLEFLWGAIFKWPMPLGSYVGVLVGATLGVLAVVLGVRLSEHV